MSRRNGDRARFQKDRKRKMLRRQRIQELSKAIVHARPPASIDPPGATGGR
jgi:hypothetical protein